MSAITPEPADWQMNQYTTTPFGSESHDPNGNLVAMNAGQANQRLLTYDYRNRMVGATLQDTGVTSRYAYDPLCRRIRKQVTGGGGRDLKFLHHGWRIAEERTTADAPQADYAYGRYLDEVLQMHRSAQTFYYHADDLLSVVATSSGLASVVERYFYSDFGLPSNLGGGQLGSVSGNPKFFTGRELDPETGLSFFRMRFLSNPEGRFLSRDPSGWWVSPVGEGNGFAYVGNEPTRLSDPLGLFEWAFGATAAPPPSAVITVVAGDPEFNRRTDSWLGPLLGFTGLAGSTRNLGYILSGMTYNGVYALVPPDSILGRVLPPYDPNFYDPGSRSEQGGVYDYVCTGIADQASRVINNAIQGGNLPGVAGAETITRTCGGTVHDAVLVNYENGTSEVFDWHKTLSPQAPVVQTPEAWRGCK
jgi:RHS repeat-associated protein